MQFAEGPMLDGLYWEQYYNNENVSQADLGYVYYENKLLGVPRLRQLRVRNDSCTVCKIITAHSFLTKRYIAFPLANEYENMCTTNLM